MSNQDGMKSEIEWSQEILKITMEIDKKFPELSKYIEEMPMDVSEKESNGVHIMALKEYYDSLVNLFEDYAITHTIA